MFKMALFFKKTERLFPKSVIQTNTNGDKVLTKTEDFRLFVIRDADDNILGTVLLTEAQQEILNESCKTQGIRFTRK
jgi:hypothetical protein